jgi:hypothetical protein
MLMVVFVLKASINRREKKRQEEKFITIQLQSDNHTNVN